jgi:AcrR family transcriptional regulator
MPKVTRSSDEVDAVREQILSRAFEILVKNGFENLSMAKIGSKMKMTAANIYNYYANKDELLIAIHKKAYGMLYDKLSDAISTADTPLEKSKKLVNAFIEFGTQNKNIYDVMFNRPIRQHSDYIGTPQEELSNDEFESSLRTMFLAVDVFQEYLKTRPDISSKFDPKLFIIEIISALHGLISLYNSGVFSQITDNPEADFKSIIDNMAQLVLG